MDDAGAMDHIYEYFEQKRAEFKLRSSGGVTDAELDEMFQAAADGQSGLIIGELQLDADASIGIFERAELINGRPHRTRYSYFLVVDGAEVLGYERHATHDPPEHRHLSGHQFEPWQAVSFAEAADAFWDELTQIRERQAEEAA